MWVLRHFSPYLSLGAQGQVLVRTVQTNWPCSGGVSGVGGRDVLIPAEAGDLSVIPVSMCQEDFIARAGV